jgi:hypothetical protein
MTMYTTLVGLLNVHDYDAVTDLLGLLGSRLRLLLQQGDYEPALLLVRFFADLVNVSAVLPSACFGLFRTLLEPLGPGTPVSRLGDAMARIVLHSLPWVGRRLAESNAEALVELMAQLSSYVTRRGTAHVSALRILPPPAGDTAPEDELAYTLAQVTALAARDWGETVLPRVYVSLLPALQSSPHGLPDIALPPSPARPAPMPTVLLRLFPPSITGLPSSIQRFSIEAAARAMLRTHVASFRRFVDAVATYHADQDAPPLDHVIVETILGDLLRQPESRLSRLFYFNALAELARTRAETREAIVTGMATLFASVSLMDVGSLAVFIEWAAHFIAYFEFRPRWQDWRPALSDLGGAQAMFVRETLARAMRLSFYARLVRTVPADLAPLLPPSPSPVHPFAGMSSEAVAAVGYQETMATLTRRSTTPGDLKELLRRYHPTNPAMQLRVFLNAVLRQTERIPNYVLLVLTKFQSVFAALFSDRAHRVLGLQLIKAYWAHRPQLVIFWVDQLMWAHILDGGSVAEWVLRKEMRTENPGRFTLWETLYTAFDTLVALTQNARAEWLKASEAPGPAAAGAKHAVSPVAATAESLAAARTTLSAALVELFRLWASELQSRAEECPVLLSRFHDAGRRYLDAMVDCGAWQILSQEVFTPENARAAACAARLKPLL